ncbi:hypothetical protein B296_00003186 [Ensete ventricosum]|uniref:Uncharacterized protein n=1 Tax=Ensete ventricosum TaxID=4639 RepID=A0A427BBC0_ENSVE|nr:hypothetical protein B296_00003186 [Ensete ventricosum]
MHWAVRTDPPADRNANRLLSGEEEGEPRVSAALLIPSLARSVTHEQFLLPAWGEETSPRVGRRNEATSENKRTRVSPNGDLTRGLLTTPAPLSSTTAVDHIYTRLSKYKGRRSHDASNQAANVSTICSMSGPLRPKVLW